MALRGCVIVSDTRGSGQLIAGIRRYLSPRMRAMQSDGPYCPTRPPRLMLLARAGAQTRLLVSTLDSSHASVGEKKGRGATTRDARPPNDAKGASWLSGAGGGAATQQTCRV